MIFIFFSSQTNRFRRKDKYITGIYTAQLRDKSIFDNAEARIFEGNRSVIEESQVIKKVD